MSTGAYAFLYFGDTEQLLPAIEAVQDLPELHAWHAVDGHYHLALTLQDGGDAVRQNLETLSGLQQLLFCPVERELRGGFTVESEPTYAWLTMEIERDKEDAVMMALDALPTEQLRVLAAGTCGAVAVAEGPTFEAIDRLVDAQIRPLDGVLRVKRDWIIDLTQI